MNDCQSHFHAKPEWWEKLKPLARQMRHEPTAAEEHLWQHLRNRRVNDAKFRRQCAIERFIVDFVCLEHRLIVEVDGGIHKQQVEYDDVRQSFLESLGFHVLRFNNSDVMQSTDVVIGLIADVLVRGETGVNAIERNDHDHFSK